MPIGICRLCIIYHPPMVAKLRRTERSSTSPVQPALHNGTRVENIHPTSLSFTDYSTSLEVTPIPGCTIWMNEDRDSSWLIFNLNHDDLTVLPLEREDRKTEGRYYRYWMNSRDAISYPSRCRRAKQMYMLSYLMPNATKLRCRGLIAPWEYTCFKFELRTTRKSFRSVHNCKMSSSELNTTAGGKP